MKVLNLYAGIGGNRKLWEGVEVTAVEYTEKIADVYGKLYPEDEVIVADAHEYLLQNYEKYDFIWSSPPCQSHSKMAKATRHNVRRYTDLRLYEEIMLLQEKFKGAWVVENVVPYYEPLIEPSFKVGRHLFWASRECRGVSDVSRPKNFINSTNLAGRKAMQDWLGIHFEEVLYYEGNHCPAQILRNAVHPEVGKGVFECLTKTN
jgi:DNA (cytosine-5)-methyltransferase 1